MEAPDSGTYQQRVGHMRLLGEMYNFRLVDSRYVLLCLQLLLDAIVCSIKMGFYLPAM